MRWLTNILDDAIDWLIPPESASPSWYDPFFRMVLDKVKWEFRPLGGLKHVDPIGTRIHDHATFATEMRHFHLGEFSELVNVHENLYQVYHILAGNGRHYLTVIYDPFDPWDSEFVLENFEVNAGVVERLLAVTKP